MEKQPVGIRPSSTVVIPNLGEIHAVIASNGREGAIKLKNLAEAVGGQEFSPITSRDLVYTLLQGGEKALYVLTRGMSELYDEYQIGKGALFGSYVSESLLIDPESKKIVLIRDPVSLKSETLQKGARNMIQIKREVLDNYLEIAEKENKRMKPYQDRTAMVLEPEDLTDTNFSFSVGEKERGNLKRVFGDFSLEYVLGLSDEDKQKIMDQEPGSLNVKLKVSGKKGQKSVRKGEIPDAINLTILATPTSIKNLMFSDGDIPRNRERQICEFLFKNTLGYLPKYISENRLSGVSFSYINQAVNKVLESGSKEPIVAQIYFSDDLGKIRDVTGVKKGLIFECDPQLEKMIAWRYNVGLRNKKKA